MSIETAEQFKALVESIESSEHYQRPAAFGIGLATLALHDLQDPSQVATDATVLDTWFQAPNLGENFGTAAVLAQLVGHTRGTASYRLTTAQLQTALSRFKPFLEDGKPHANIEALQCALASLQRLEQIAPSVRAGTAPLNTGLPKVAVVTFVGALQDDPVDTHDAYLRLHLLSSRKVQPHGVSLAGLFGKLANVVWTNVGPFSPEGFETVRGRLLADGVSVHVHSIDKIPRMTDYVLPTGVRIADADRVRLGGHVAEGTTVMHEGFINFNAGTLGTAMVEGRISAGVVVGNGTDIGGGASIMGTLSGGGKTVISLGTNCLLGANSGCGIALGNGCTVEAGCYVTDGAKVTLPDGRVVKARELSGASDLLFLRNSQTGAIEVRHKRNETVLNEALHSN